MFILLSLLTFPRILFACLQGHGAPIPAKTMEMPLALSGAAGHLHQAVSTSSQQAQAYYDQGIANLAVYQWIDASRSFHEALRIDPDLAMAHVGLFRAYLGAGDFAQIKNHLAKAVTLKKERKITAKESKWIELARLQFAAIYAPPQKKGPMHQLYKQSIEKLIEMDYDDAHAWVLAGNAEEPGAWGRGQYGTQTSILYYKKALGKNPDHTGAIHFMAHSYENIGDYKTASEFAKHLEKAVPGVPHAQHMAGHALPKLGQWKKALKYFEKADTLHRQYFKSTGIPPEEDWHFSHNLLLMGLVHFRLGNIKKAEQALEELCELKPRFFTDDFNCVPLMEFWLYQEQPEKTLQKAQELLNRPSDEAQYAGLALEAQALQTQDKTGEAQEASRKAALIRGKLFQKLNDPTTAQYMKAKINPLLDMLDENRFLALADEIIASPPFDAWSEGILRLKLMMKTTRKRGREDLYQALSRDLGKIDPELAKT